MPVSWKRWQPPPSDSFKLNVDGALSLNYGLHGVRAVIRDSYGRLCGVVAMRAPSLISVLATEFYALKIGISFAVDASFSPLLVESDSLVLSNCFLLMTSDSSLFHRRPSLFILFPMELQIVSLVSVFAKRILSFWFTDPPLWLQDCLYEDSSVSHDV